MRIGITCYPTYGGSGAVATELGLELARRGHEIHLISYASPFRLRPFHDRVYFHEVDLSGAYPLLEYFPYSLALAVTQEEVALREQLDIMHVHYAVPHATAAFLAREMIEAQGGTLKVVTTLHGTDITLVGQERSFYTVTKFSIEQSNAVTAVSRYLKAETHRAFLCGDCPIEVIPNFINPMEYFPGEAPDCRRAFAPEGVKVLMHVSNFRPIKRAADVVRIFAKVREQVPSVLVLVGDGPERPIAEAEAERLGVQEHVKSLGKVSEVADVLRAADLFLLPSASESFGLSALEAMACGVPVVASNVGGIPEVVVNGTTGALEAAGDIDAMAASAIALLEPERWAAARAASVQRAHDFHEAKIVPLYEDLYRRVLSE